MPPNNTISAQETERLNRRRFMNALGGAVTVPILGSQANTVLANTTPSPSAESLVTEFYETLSEKQLLTICFPFEHPLRHRVNANWNITEPRIGDDDFYTAPQQDLITKIVQSITSEEGFKRLMQQMDEDSGGIEEYSVALFGDPGRSKFQWELTGRHLTLRADGNSVEKAAFGGPIIYGHSEEDPDLNLYHYQTVKTNEVIHALDGSQIDKALLPRAPRETDIALQGTKGSFPGIAGSELSSDQKTLVKETLQVLLAPYREEDSKEVLDIIEAGGGIDDLHMAFYKQGDLEGDRVWDMWRVEGPSFVWNFRGAPHVHAYINIGFATNENSTAQTSRGGRNRGPNAGAGRSRPTRRRSSPDRG